MKKVSIFLGLVALIGISSVVLIKTQKNNSGEGNGLSPVTSTSPSNNSAGSNSTKFDPIKNPEAVELIPNSNITVNRNMPSPEGNNRLPTIVRPTHNPQATISPPPEAILMVECQSQSNGNPETMRKCFEAKIHSNVNAQVSAVQAQNNVANTGYTQQSQSLPNKPSNSIQQAPAIKTPQSNSGVFR